MSPLTSVLNALLFKITAHSVSHFLTYCRTLFKNADSSAHGVIGSWSLNVMIYSTWSSLIDAVLRQRRLHAHTVLIRTSGEYLEFLLEKPRQRKSTIDVVRYPEAITLPS
jgi:hypothetical protein